MKLKTEQEYFAIIDSFVTLRTEKLYEHFGKNFLESYTSPDERDWYEQNISNIDNYIVQNANDLCKVLKLKKIFKKVADVFKDETISDWYNKLKIQKNKRNGMGKN